MSSVRLLRICVALAAVGAIALPASASAAPVLTLSGSTSVAPLASLLARGYLKANPGAVKFKLAQGGSDVGVADVAAGRVSIGMSSRDPKTSDRGVSFNKIAKDGICVITNNSNPITDLSQAQIKSIFGGGERDWSGITGSPISGAIDVTVRTAASGTQDAFQKIFLGTTSVTSAAAQKASNGLIQQAVKSNKNAVGYVSMDFTDGVNAAAYNGVVGLKTTYGRIPKSGFFPLAWSMDSVGPLARRVEDVALLLDASSGFDASDPSSLSAPLTPALPGLHDGVQGLRIGVPEDFFWHPIQDEVDAPLRRALDVLRDAGADVRPITIAGGEHLPLSVAVSFVLVIVESAAWHRSWLTEKPWGYAPDVYEYISWAKRIPATDFVDAQRVRRLITNVVDSAFHEVDLLAVPAQCQVAARVDTPLITFADGTTEHRDPAGIRNLAIFNLTGHPGVSVPVGRGAASGMPVGLQLVGRRGDDATTLRAAQVIENALGTLGEPPLPG